MTQTIVPAPSELSHAELLRLTVYKWRYCFETMGFERQAAGRLAFLAWLVRTGQVQP